MVSHVFAGKHNLNKISTTVAAVYTFIALASLASQSVYAAKPGSVIETRRNSRLPDVGRKGGQELVRDEFKISIDIKEIRARQEDTQTYDISEDTRGRPHSSNNIQSHPSARRLTGVVDNLTPGSDPGSNDPPVSPDLGGGSG